MQSANRLVKGEREQIKKKIIALYRDLKSKGRIGIRYGFVSKRDIAKRFGVNESAVGLWIREYEKKRSAKKCKSKTSR